MGINFKKLSKLKKERNLVVISRSEITDYRISGYILAYSDELLLLQYVDELNLDGFMVLPLCDITKIRSKKIEKFQTQLMKDDGLYDQIPFDTIFRVNNWQTVLSTIGVEAGIVIVEDEIDEEPFFLGEIKKILQDHVKVLHFDAQAIWEEKPCEVDYLNITCFQAGNNYTNVYKRYFERTGKL